MKFPTAILATLILAGGTAFVITAPKMSFANPLAGGAPANVLIYHNDGFNDGQNLKETVLTPDVVRSANFGKLLSIHLAGAESGQPLFKAGVNITVGPHQGVQNVVFVALNNDSVWAINADTGAVLWKTSLLTRFHGVADTVAAADGNRSTGRGLPLEDTPAIDPNTNVLYVECSVASLYIEISAGIHGYAAAPLPDAAGAVAKARAAGTVTAGHGAPQSLEMQSVRPIFDGIVADDPAIVWSAITGVAPGHVESVIDHVESQAAAGQVARVKYVASAADSVNCGSTDVTGIRRALGNVYGFGVAGAVGKVQGGQHVDPVKRAVRTGTLFAFFAFDIEHVCVWINGRGVFQR